MERFQRARQHALFVSFPDLRWSLRNPRLRQSRAQIHQKVSNRLWQMRKRLCTFQFLTPLLTPFSGKGCRQRNIFPEITVVRDYIHGICYPCAIVIMHFTIAIAFSFDISLRFPPTFTNSILISSRQKHTSLSTLFQGNLTSMDSMAAFVDLIHRRATHHIPISYYITNISVVTLSFGH